MTQKIDSFGSVQSRAVTWRSGQRRGHWARIGLLIALIGSPVTVQTQADADAGAAMPPAASLQTLRRQAEDADTQAMIQLGLRLLAGQGTAADPVAGTAWFRQALDAGDEHAGWYLGLSYLDGAGVDRDLDQAAQLFERAAEAGHPEAMLHQAHRSLEGSPSPEAIQQAIGLARRAAASGLIEALTEIGSRLMAADHSLVVRDEGRQLLRAAAEGGHAQAAYLMGWVVRQERDLGAIEQEDWATWWGQAAEAGHTEALYQLGLWHAGLLPDQVQAVTGPPRDPRHGEALLRQVAEAGYAPAMMAMAQQRLSTGQEAEAEAWVLRAAEAGVPLAIQAQIERLARGVGGQADFAAALSWLRRWLGPEADAAAAWRSFGRDLARGESSDGLEAFGRYVLDQVAPHDQGQAVVESAQLWLEGIGVHRDPAKAIARLRAVAGTQPHAAAALLLLHAGGDAQPHDDAELATWREGQTIVQGHPGTLLALARTAEAAGQAERAERFWGLAAEAGAPEAMYRRAAAWLRIVERQDDGRLWLQRAAEGGHGQAMHDWAVIQAGGHGVPRDAEEAVRWWRQAAEAGHAWSRQQLAVRGLLEEN